MAKQEQKILMRKVKLYIAISLDGFIARKNGALDWLEGIPNPNKLDYGYQAFYDSIDTVLMGRVTYNEILGFGVDWPYGNCQSVVFSRNKSLKISTPKTQLINEAVTAYVHRLKQQTGKDIWLVGGGNLLTSFLNEGLVDEMIIAIAPVVIGEGLPLFPNVPQETTLELVDTTSYDTGFVSLTYRVN
ncbi:riboflavin biosynthesis protein RibD C-terminal domain protein [Microscilla marina ATCC 23134]|uniref:Riboflavin biosynthesis protein RibD C-terminal domain protein n=2 Tax=Microscilla marina TaxID=1027 RepID=A1ZHA9_MICM2|nr:riboflavin biosynthesis protein RibD C-terminal domain protein [Microscilla marina ATCC 23134]